MATRDQMDALLSVGCPWCGAAPRSLCTATPGSVMGNRKRRVEVSTLDGGCHDARWRRALDMDAPVLPGAVEDRRVLVSSGPRPAERPW